MYAVLIIYAEVSSSTCLDPQSIVERKMALPLILGMSLIIIITIIIIIIFIASMKLLLQRLRYKLPPGPFPLPILGNFFDFEAKPILVRGFTDWAQIHGPIFSLYFGPYLGIVVNTVELAKQVLKDNDQHLANRNRTMLIAKFSKNGKDLMWSDYGPHYVKVRKLCSLQLFSMKRIDALRPIRHDEVTAMVESIYNDYCIKPENKGKALAMREYVARMAFLHMTRLTFGKRFVDSDGNIDAQGQELKRILANGGKLFSKESIAEFVPWIAFLFRGEKRALEEQVAMVDSFTKKIMEENALARNKTGNTKNHFLDALLTLQEEYDLSEDTIIGLLWDMISAGMESVIIAVEWGMAEMVRNLRVQKKIQEELHRVIGHDRVMTEADIPNLPYLQCAIKECLRIHSPTPLMLPHQASTNVKIGGYDVPKGATVTVNTWAISRDPAVWKDPLEFRPERFQEEDIDMKGTDYRLLPFGSGRRYCPGAQLAITLMSSMIGHLLHHFSWASPPGVKPEDMDMMEEPGTVTYMGTPLQAVPTPRLSAHLHKRVAVGNV